MCSLLRLRAFQKTMQKYKDGPTDTFVGFSGGCALPGSVIVKRFASVTLWSGCIVLALAHQVSIPVFDAPWRVSITLTSASDLQIWHGVKIGISGQLRVILIFVSESVQSAESHLNICGGHPVLKYGWIVKVVRGGSPVQGAKRDQPTGERVHVGVRICADGLLLVLLSDRSFTGLVEHLSTLGWVVLERHPGLSVVHRFKDSHGLWSRWAELQTHVGHLKFLD